MHNRLRASFSDRPSFVGRGAKELEHDGRKALGRPLPLPLCSFASQSEAGFTGPGGTRTVTAS